MLTEVLGKLRPYFGDLESLVDRSVVQRWDNCALMITPGIFRLMSGFKRGTTSKLRVQLAGDYAQFSSVNTAVVSGRSALAALGPLPETMFKEGLSELARFAVARKH